METNNKNNINDETRSDENIEQKGTVNNSVLGKMNNVRSGLNKSMFGAASAVAGGGVAAVTASFGLPDESMINPDPNAEPVLEPEHFNGNEVPIATGVNDSMSFDQAFATARQETGAGSVFNWHGNNYGTFYFNEWQEFSEDYKDAFSNFPYIIEQDPDDIVEIQETPEDINVIGNINVIENMNIIENLNIIENVNVIENLNILEVPDTEEEEEIEEEDSEEEETEEEGIGEEVETGEEATLSSDVTVLNAEQFEIDGQDVSVVFAALDGQDVALVDTNADDSYDILVVDDNGNIEIPSDYTIEDSLDVEQVDNTEIDDSINHEYDAGDDLQDLINDTDISEFIA